MWVPGAPGGPGDSPGAGPEVATLERPAPAGSSSLGAAAASPPPWPGPRSPASCPAVGGSPLRRAGWAGMAAGTLLEAGLARVLYYPTLLYTVFRGKMPGRAHRDWYHRIDSTVLLGALPLRSMTRRVSRAGSGRGRACEPGERRPGLGRPPLSEPPLCLGSWSRTRTCAG